METFRWVLMGINLLVAILNIGVLWWLMALTEEIRKLQYQTRRNFNESEMLRQRFKRMHPDYADE